MAGSYNHATTKKSKLRNHESFVGMIENLGDAYEAIEEMYGMIWYLANEISSGSAWLADQLVERARVNYLAGIIESPGHQK